MKVYFNEDSSHFCYMLDWEHIDPTPEAAAAYIESFRGTDVTDFIMNVNATTATYDSKVMQNYCDKYEMTEENGVSVDYKNTFVRPAYEMYRLKGFDYFQIWIEKVRELGMTPWMSIRMNDAHALLDQAHVVKGAYTSDHPELWRVTEKNADGYYDRCLNYLKPEVRAYMLAFIEEVLDRYDIDGLELDFTREIYCFPVGMEWKGRPVMNAFLGEVRTLLWRAEERRGHKIRLSALMWETPSVNYQMGFDVYHWIREGLVDLIVPIVHWVTTWFDMPIDEWMVLTKGTNVEIAAGQQELVSAYPGAMTKNSNVDMAFGQAAANLSKGADAVYLYNYMAWGTLLDEYNWGSEGDITQQKNLDIILHNIGSLEKILLLKRTSVLTYSDNTPYWMPFPNRLPMWVGETRPGDYFRIATGKLTTERAELIVGIDFPDGIMGELTVYCNGKPTEAFGECQLESAFHQPDLRYFKFRLNTEGCGNTQVLHIYSTKTCWMKWAQIDVTPV